MAPLGPPAAFPDVDLAGLDGKRAPISEAWARGWALIAVGHSECGTTRLCLPFIDRIHHRRPPTSTAVAVLQDTARDARALIEELALELPVRLEEDPHPPAAQPRLGTVPTLFPVAPPGRHHPAPRALPRAALAAVA